MIKTVNEALMEAQREADKHNRRRRQRYGAYRQRVRERGGNGTGYYPIKPSWKTVDYIDLCRYDKEFKYAVEVKVKKDGFPLGHKGDILRFSVSEYGFRRLLWDDMHGLIDVTANSLYIQGFDFPDITDEDIETRTEETRKALFDAIEKGEPIPKGYGLLDDEDD